MAAFIPAAISAAGSIGGGFLAGRGQGESRMQRTQRKLVDKLLGSLNGEGPYKDLFSFDENTFQKSFVEPAKSRFRNQIAPQIQQEYIQSGQQRGTGLDDQLLRAGVDLDQLLNQHMYQAQEAAKQRGAGAIGNVFGVGGAPAQLTGGQAFGQSVGGYLSSPAFGEALKGFNQPATAQAQQPNVFTPPPQPTRKGYLPDWGLSDPRWGQR